MADQIRILVVEDSEEDQEFYRRSLAKGLSEPFQTVWAEDGISACELVPECCPDIILLDYQLPDLDGLEVISSLREAMREEDIPPVIMMTGQGREQVAVEAMKLGSSDYLVKGQVTPEQLGRTIRSALKQAQLNRAVAASEQRFYTSVETMLDCFGTYVAVRDETGQIISFSTEYINAAAGHRTNVQLHQESEDFQIFEPPSWTAELFGEYCELVETGAPLCKEVLIYRENQPTEIERAYDLRASKLEDGFVAIWRDITGKKRAELEYVELLRKEQAARAEAEAANRAKDEFLAMVSHDLRTPLNSILGWAEMLQRRSTPEIMERALETIHRNAQHQLGLVNDLLDVSRALSGSLELDCKLLNITELCNLALSAAYPEIQAKAISLTYQVGDLPAIEVDEDFDWLSQASSQEFKLLGDSNRLAQVLGNLLTNAIKFTPSDGLLAFTIAATEAEVVLSLQDSGKGIAPELLPHVFDRFCQGEHAEKSQGLGLGLAIAHSIIELHGGEIWAESDGVGCGAKFSIKLPANS